MSDLYHHAVMTLLRPEILRQLKDQHETTKRLIALIDKIGTADMPKEEFAATSKMIGITSMLLKGLAARDVLVVRHNTHEFAVVEPEIKVAVEALVIGFESTQEAYDDLVKALAPHISSPAVKIMLDEITESFVQNSRRFSQHCRDIGLM